jgi:hypothetical protein
VSTASVEFDWEKVTPAAVLQAAERAPSLATAPWYRFGDGFLQVASDHQPLLDELGAIYGDCEVPDPPAGAFCVRCRATRVPGSPLLSVSFDGPSLPDLIDAARSPYRFLRRPPYVEAPGPMPGWRALVNRDDRRRFLVASQGSAALVNLDEAPPESLVDWVVCVVQAAQAGVLFLHAGSVGVAGSGALILGRTGGGKSTTSLSLAWRGHAFLGDDVAAVRLASTELLPFPRSAGLREGPLARSLAAQVRASRHVVATNRHGIRRTLVRVSDLFPASVSGPLPLRFAFVLDGFADRATIAPFRPELGELKRLQCVVTDTSSAWGMSPGRDLMLFLSVVNLLSGLRCHLVQHGSPEETARVIEAAMMEGACT